MNLKLERPIVFFDLETTRAPGQPMSPQTDRAVQLAVKKISPDGDSYVNSWLINPTVPINPDSTAVHHITDDMVANEPTFAELSQEFNSLFFRCDAGGYNITRYDLPLLAAEFERCHIEFPAPDFDIKIADSYVIYAKKEERTLEAAFLYYCKKKLVGAHGALADTEASLEVLLSQIEMYDNIGQSIDEISSFVLDGKKIADLSGRLIYNESGELIFNFGKYRGQVVKKYPEYVGWMLRSDFPLTTKRALKNALKLS